MFTLTSLLEMRALSTKHVAFCERSDVNGQFCSSTSEQKLCPLDTELPKPKSGFSHALQNESMGVFSSMRVTFLRERDA